MAELRRMGRKAKFSSSWSPRRGGKRQRVAEEAGEKAEPSSSMIIELFIFRCLCSEFCRTAFIQIYITLDIYCVKKFVNKGPFCGS